MVSDLLRVLQDDGYSLDSADDQDLTGTPRSRRQAAKRLIVDAGQCDVYISKDECAFWLNIVLDVRPEEIVNDFTAEENLEKTIDKFCALWEGRACPTNKNTKTTTTMQLTPPYLEQDYDDSDESPAFEIPGIDDCDFLYSLYSRSGDDSVYIRVHECNPGEYHAALTVDSETGHFVEDIPGNPGPFKLPEHACAANLELARDWFRQNKLAYCYCNASQKVARKYPHGLAPA